MKLELCNYCYHDKQMHGRQRSSIGDRWKIGCAIKLDHGRCTCPGWQPYQGVLGDGRSDYIVRAFLAGLSMETCDNVFYCARGLSEKIIRDWAKTKKGKP